MLKAIKMYKNMYGIKFKKEASDILRLDQGIVWCRRFDTPEGRSEIRGMF